MSTINRLKRTWQSDPAFRQAYAALKPEFSIARQLIAARNRAGLSQAEVARRMRTTQSTIARLESGHGLPAMSSLQRYASAIGRRLEVRLVEAGK
jgi:predicted transcriptional regulator